MTRKILFFPFTHMTQEQLNTATSFFSGFDFLAVDKEGSEQSLLMDYHKKGIINLLFPSQQEMEVIDQATAQYLNWAAIHKGNEHNLKAMLRDAAYFTDDTHVSSIKSQLLGPQEQEKNENQKPLWEQTLLFLKLTQLCDAQQDSIDTQLRQVEKSKDALVMELRGLNSPLAEPEEKSIRSDYGDKMTQERVINWAGYMGQKGQLEHENNYPVLMTTSQSVFDWFESNCEQVVNPLDIQKLKVHHIKCDNYKNWQQQFTQVLMSAASGNKCREEDLPEMDDDCSVSAQCKLGLFSGKDINLFFNASGKPIPVCLVKLK